MESLATLGRYRVLEPIGAGGMSTVYAGEHQTLRRPVAIKVLHRQLVRDSVMARRMIGEAFTIAALHHPGIVGVLDVGVSEDGRAYVVMERLIGETLSTRLRRGRLSEAKVLVFARQIASALAATHAAGVIHRDLKPENLFVVPDSDVPGGERMKVLDFGIAWRDQVGREKTLTGVVLGTPSYMAPEQLDGSGDLDPRVDVFALGVVMYQMVTGSLPFAGANTEQLLIEQAYCAPTPAASLAPVSHALSTIIDRCLAKKPSGRFTTMAALVGELGRTGLPIPAATNGFESEDTNPDMPEPLGDTIEEAAGEAVSTKEHTARHVSRAPIPRRRRWIAPVAIAAAVAVGMFAAIVPRRAMRRDAAPAPVPAIDVNTPEMSRADLPPPRRERAERADRAAPKPERVSPKAERISSKPEPARAVQPPRAEKPAPRRLARKPREMRETKATPTAPPAPTGNQFAAVETPTLY